MNEVECRLASFEIACEGFGIRKIRLPDFDSGILSPFAALQLAPASGRDNGSSSRNRADAERGVRQCSRWLPQSRHVADWSFQISLDPTFLQLRSGLPRLLQPADVETLRSGFLDESIVCGIVHLGRSRQNPKIFPGWVADQRMRVIRRERNDLIVSPNLRNKRKESRSEPHLQDRIRLSFADNARHTLCLDLALRFPAGSDSAPRSFRWAATCIVAVTSPAHRF